MSVSEPLWRASRPWAGLVAGVAGGALAHQFGAEGTFDDCLTISPGPLLIVSVICILVTLAAGWISAAVARERSEGATRRLIAVVSVGMAGLVPFAILLPMIASAMLPPCFQ